MKRVKPIKLPKFLDVLLIINQSSPRTRINRLLQRSEGYIISGLRFLEEHGLVSISAGARHSKELVVSLTPKGIEVQLLVQQLYARLGLNFCVYEEVDDEFT